MHSNICYVRSATAALEIVKEALELHGFSVSEGDRGIVARRGRRFGRHDRLVVVRASVFELGGEPEIHFDYRGVPNLEGFFNTLFHALAKSGELRQGTTVRI